MHCHCCDAIPIEKRKQSTCVFTLALFGILFAFFPLIGFGFPSSSFVVLYAMIVHNGASLLALCWRVVIYVSIAGLFLVLSFFLSSQPNTRNKKRLKPIFPFVAAAIGLEFFSIQLLKFVSPTQPCNPGWSSMVKKREENVCGRDFICFCKTTLAHSSAARREQG